MLCRFPLSLFLATWLLTLLGCAGGCSSDSKSGKTTPAPPPTPAPVVAAPAPPPPPPENLPPVMLGIDVLEANGFKEVAGKRIGLLTHTAGVNRRGESTINVLRRAPQTKLVALFAPEHGLDGQIKAATNFGDSIHAPTGLPIYSVYGRVKKPTPAMLKGIDALVIDLQDIGVRSYTFISWMRYAMEACFDNDIECIVLDRPNPLGGLKVDGPPLDAEWMSDVGAFRVPYVHSLTIGELATIAKTAPRVMAVTEKARAKGKLTVIPMRGWNRAMRWPETGLKWVPTSPMIQTFDAVIGYAMVGLGCQNSGWSSGIGRQFPFRGIAYPKKTPDEIIKAMEAYKIPGIEFLKRSGITSDGKPAVGVYVEISDWDQWRPTELSFYMHKQAALWERPLNNPFAKLDSAQQRTFQIHVGSTAWHDALRREGGRVNIESFLANWRSRAAVYNKAVQKYRLYP